MYQLRKVKGQDNSYKVLLDGERPEITLEGITFTKSKRMCVTKRCNLSEFLKIEKGLIDHITNEAGTKRAIGGLQVEYGKQSFIDAESKDDLEVNVENVYNVTLRCRAVKYVNEYAIICWAILDVKKSAFLIDDDEDVQSDTSSDEDEIEPPVDELMELKQIYLERLNALLEKYSSLKNEIETASLVDIPSYGNVVDKIYNE